MALFFAVVFFLKYLIKHIGPQEKHSWELSLAYEAHMFLSLLSNSLKSIFKCLKKNFTFHMCTDSLRQKFNVLKMYWHYLFTYVI